MPNDLQACAGELARLSRLLCKKTTLRCCLGRAGWSLVLLALGPVRQQMLSGGLLARGPAYGACQVSGASGGYRWTSSRRQLLLVQQKALSELGIGERLYYPASPLPAHWARLSECSA